jgi:hypothetical protein
MLGELGYTIGGKATTGTNYSTKDRDNLVAMLSSGTADMTRIANLITSPFRKADALTVTKADTPTLFNVYTNAGVIKPPAGGGTTTTGGKTAEVSSADALALAKAGDIAGAQAILDAATGKPAPKPAPKLSPALQQNVSRMQATIASKPGPFRKKAEGSPEHGEYADPAEDLRERLRLRRQEGDMDQGSARDRLKKFLGGEDLTPVQGFAKGGAAVKDGGTPITYQEAIAFRDSETGSQIPRIERLLRPSNWNNLNSGLKKQYLKEIQGAMNDPVNYSLNQLKKDAAGYTVYQGLPGGGGTAKAEARDLKSNIDRYTSFLQSNNQAPEAIASTVGQGYTEGARNLKGQVKRMNDEPVLNRISDVALQLGLGAATSGLSLPGQIAANAALQLGQGTKPMDAFKDVPRAGGAYLGRGLFSNIRTPPSFAHGGAVHRAQGSPVYGEMADTGGVTPETIAALRNRQGLSATEALNALKKIYGEGISNAESVLRGSAAAIPGSFGDIESLFRESDKTRKLATTEEVLRDYMPKRVTKPTKETKGFEETGTYMPLPIPTSAVKKAGAVAKTGAKKALEELAPTAAGMAERQLQRSGLGPMYAVKPGGGTFFPPGYGSRLDDYLENAVKNLSQSETLAGKDAKTVADFIRTKGRKYLTTTYGTADDPLRAALSEGRLPRFGSDKERFRTYVLKAVEAGDSEALQDLERTYDSASGVNATSYLPPEKQGYKVSNEAERAMRERMAAEGVDPELMNPAYPASATKEQLESSYSTQSKKNLAELIRMIEDAPTVEEKQRKLTALGGDLKSLSYAAEKGEPIYDISSPSMDFMDARNVAQGIASIPVAELERMSFPEAVIKGSQNMRLKRDWESVIRNAETGKTVPKDIFFTGTNPVYEANKNQKWVRVMTPDAVELEGAAMRHSIGGYKTSNSYNLGGKNAFNSGLARIFSLRNEKGVPQVTIETKFTDEGGLEVTQGGVRSKFNSEPTAAEKSAVFQLFDTLGPKVIKPTKYTVSRAGDSLDEPTTIDWGQEYADYLKYKNKGEE